VSAASGNPAALYSRIEGQRRRIGKRELSIFLLAVKRRRGRWWASLPSRPVLDAEGRQVSNHAGHKQYAALLGCRDRALADAFSQRLIDLLRARYPGAFERDAS
jgi:hypothetical protein